jgi:hypothetical protein
MRMISRHDCLFFTSMFLPLLFSLMLWLDLKVDSTRAGSQMSSSLGIAAFVQLDAMGVPSRRN